MTALRMTLKTSQGVEVSLRAGRDAGWPDGARMDWVRVVDGEPRIVTATLALEWHLVRGPGNGGPNPVEMGVQWGHTTPWEGFRDDEHVTSDDDDVRMAEWADTFCAEVNKSLADTAKLTAYADLHRHETEAARGFSALPTSVRRGLSARMEDGEGVNTLGERMLSRHVENVILAAATKASEERAGDEPERLGVRVRTEDMPGSERVNGWGAP